MSLKHEKIAEDITGSAFEDYNVPLWLFGESLSKSIKS